MKRKLFLAGVIIAALCTLAIGIVPAIKKPPPLTTEEVTIGMLSPYLDAAVKMEPNLEMRNCPHPENTNFDKLPYRGVNRNPLLEALALATLSGFRNNKNGDRMSSYMPIGEIDNHLREFAVGDSPWGLFADPRIQKVVAPYLETAKADAIAYSKEHS